MNLYSIEVYPENDSFFKGKNSDADSIEPILSSDISLSERLDMLYLQYVKDYRKKLDFLRYEKTAYPTITVLLPGGSQFVTFDDQLDARLLKLYILHGWEEGVLSIGKAIEGTNFPAKFPVKEIKDFYLFTRNRLFLLIRKALIEIEMKAKKLIFANLENTAKELSKAKDHFKFSEKLIWERQLKTVYKMGNHHLANELYPIISEAVSKREELDKQRMYKLNEPKTKAEFLLYGRSPFVKESEATFVQAIADNEKNMEQTKKKLEELVSQIFGKSPFSLLVLPVLKTPFDQKAMENALGYVLSDLLDRTNQFAESIKTETSMIEADSKELKIDKDVSSILLYPSNEINQIFNQNFKRTCVKKAISESKDPAYSPMLSEKTIYSLIASGSIERGSFTWIVCKRYLFNLTEELQKQKETDEQLNKMFEALGLFSAAFSLAGFLTSPFPPVSAAFHAASAVLGVPATLFGIYSVVHQINKIDQEVLKKLMETELTKVELSNIEGLARIEELKAIRDNILDNIEETIIKEIVFSAVEKWNVMKKVIQLRDYYDDLATLTGG